jgi:hypothetical protein
MRKLVWILLIMLVFSSGLVTLPAFAEDTGDDPSWTIYFRPAVRFGTDDRTLYIMDFIVPLYQGQKNLLFFNPRFTPNDVNGWETNLGLGYRHLLFNDKLILGANIYYDMRHTGWDTDHEQIGFGFEAMTEINKYVALTGRFNYYIPLTDPIVTGTPGGGGYIFRDQGIYSLGGGLVEESLEGFDGELGVRVPFISDYVETWVYGGGYHYEGDYVGTVDGWTARLELVPTDFVRLNYEYRQDNTNHGEHYGEVMFEVPFSIGNLVAGKNPFEGFGKRLSGSRDMKDRLNEPVRRDVDITVKTVETEGPGGAEGTLAEGVIFVSETGVDAPGNGTYENPYRTLTYALADARITGGTYDTIHVMDAPGTDTIPGATIALAGLTIWGSGAANPAYPTISNFTAGAHPTISSTITVNSPNVTLMGLDINVTSGSAAFFNNCLGAAIRDNLMTGVGNNEILYCRFNSPGSGTSPLVIDHNTISNTASAGGGYAAVEISSGGTNNDIFATITNNTIVQTNGGYSFGISVDSNAGIGSAANPLIISGNDITTIATGNRAWSIYLGSGYTGSAGTTFARITSNHIVNGLIGSPTSVDPNAIVWIGAKYGNAGYVGTLANPVVITDNWGSISGNPNGGRYLLYVVTDHPGAGNAVNWGGIGTGTGQNNFTASTYWGGSGTVDWGGYTDDGNPRGAPVGGYHYEPVYNQNLVPTDVITPSLPYF